MNWKLMIRPKFDEIKTHKKCYCGKYFEGDQVECWKKGHFDTLNRSALVVRKSEL